MKTYWNTQGGLSHLDEWQPNCWIQVTCPTEEDQRELEEKFNIPDYFMSDISDTDERARSVSPMSRRYEVGRPIPPYHSVSSTSAMSQLPSASMRLT